MKKLTLLAAMAAIVSLVSCQKEEPSKEIGEVNPVYPEFTASISADETKTTVNLGDGKVSWEQTDIITVSDGSNSALYKIKSIDGSGKATFEVKDNTQPVLGSGPYTATYGSTPSTSQVYSSTAGKLHMTAPSTATKSFTFTVQCGLMKLNLTKTGQSVKSIVVTGTPAGGPQTTYTLTCETAQSIATATDFFIALPEGSYNKIVITNTDDKVCTLNASSGLAINNNMIRPVTLGSSKINFYLPVPTGALPGIFSVSSTEKVYFSKGNLQYQASSKTWKFADHQYDYIGNAVGNNVTNVSTRSTQAAWIDLFGWGATGHQDTRAATYQTNYYPYSISKDESSSEAAKSKNKYGYGPDYDATNKYGLTVTNKSDWGYCMGGKSSIWRTLSGGGSGEWNYLLSTRTVNGGTGEGKSYQRATVNSNYGLIIYPDNYTAQTTETSYTSSQWITMESAGCVFLPAAGNRNGTEVTNAGVFNSYWSSTVVAADKAYSLYCDSKNIRTEYDGVRYLGRSVRLVTPAE